MEKREISHIINTFLGRWKVGLPVCFVVILLLVNSGCSRKTMTVDLPYDSLESFTLSGSEVLNPYWWKEFNDPSLTKLVDSALSNNLNLQNLWYQFREVSSVLDQNKSRLIPDLDLSIQSGISRPEPDFVGGENTQFTLGSSYEVDLWGRIRYGVHAAQYRKEASLLDYRAAAVSLAGELTLTWFRLKAASNQLDLVEKQIETNEKVLALIRARFGSGQVRGVDILRQQQLIETTLSQKISLQTQIAVLQNQLAILLGNPPENSGLTRTDSLPALPPLPETGVPMALINRRPDVLSSFSNLQASDRELAAAISNKYPRLNLSLTAAVRSNTFSIEQLINSQAYTLSAGLLAPLFYGGRLRAQVEQAENVRSQQLSQYGQTVLTAFQEVENALIREKQQKEQLLVIERQVERAERVYQQLRIEYLNGTSEYLDVLTALNQEQQLKRDLIRARLDLLSFRVSLYRALAGGIDTDREKNLDG